VLTLAICWVGNETETTYSWIAMLSNTLVHSLMYFYYAYHSFTGRRLWWAKYLTQLQMTQFAFNGIAMLLWIYLDQTRASGCSGNYVGVAACMWAMVSYFALFANMYRGKYSGEKNAAGAAEKNHQLPNQRQETLRVGRISPPEGYPKAG
jgi:hypothetical protein